jgi:Holliday junction resolvase RusA-like endonuclease
VTIVTPIRFTIIGEPASKANSRKLVTINKRPAFIKSEKARDYERDALLQIPPHAKVMIDCDVAVTIRIFYATQRPDLDESVILDVLQAKYKVGDHPNAKRELVRKGVYINDRQVREKHIYHAIDRANPRADIEIVPIGPQQLAMMGAA